MTREETKKVLMMVQAAYPNYKPLDKTVAIDTWNLLLSEYTYQQVENGLRVYILSDISGFPPSIGQIVDKIKMISGSEQINELEAWALVSKAISNSAYNSANEFAKLPDIVQKAVGDPEYLRRCAIDEKYNESVVSSNFMRAYKKELERSKQVEKMPMDIKLLLQNYSGIKQINQTDGCKTIKETKLNECEISEAPKDWRDKIQKRWSE